jgi:macrodomain Ter protein organizer (MatP/YcbG family)
MEKQITLKLDEKVVQLVKEYADQQQITISEFIERLIKTSQNKPKHSRRVGPITQRLTGVAKLPDNYDEKKEIIEYLEKKHL